MAERLYRLALPDMLLLPQAMDVDLPQEMIDGMTQFRQFYEATNKHRKLGWVYALGSAHVKGNFDARPVELILTTLQATVLLLFSTGGSSHEPVLL